MRVAGDQPDAGQAAGDQVAQERQPARTVLGGGDLQAEDLAVPVAVHPGRHQGVHVQQSILSFNGTMYKVMAGGSSQVSTDPRFAGVFRSLKVLDPAPVPAADAPSSDAISIKAAEIGVSMLFIAGIVWLVTRSSRRKSPKTPPVP